MDPIPEQNHTGQNRERRGILTAGARIAAGVALASAVTAILPPVVLAGEAPKGKMVEKNALTLGFVPLTDCAPLVVAKEMGFFADEGLDVTLSREPSWANIRDKVSVGILDGAQMLAGIPLAANAGIGAFNVPMVAPLVLDLGGNAITLSRTLMERMEAADPAAMAERPLSARALKRVIEADRAAGAPRLTFGVVFSVASHAYQLRYWLAEAGIDPDADVRLVVIPPPDMVTSLQLGAIDGFCVGEPWNSLAAATGIGRIAITSHALWANAPEKVLGVTAEWAARHPATLAALVRALVRAGRWLDQPENRRVAAALLSDTRYVGAAASVLDAAFIGALTGAGTRNDDFVVFHRYAAGFPWHSHAVWTLAQMVRWGQVPFGTDLAAIAAATHRTDLYRAAVAGLDEPLPLADSKVEGTHATPWTLTDATSPIPMGPDRFLDGQPFDPADVAGYLKRFAITRHVPVPEPSA